MVRAVKAVKKAAPPKAEPAKAVKRAAPPVVSAAVAVAAADDVLGVIGAFIGSIRDLCDVAEQGLAEMRQGAVVKSEPAKSKKGIRKPEPVQDADEPDEAEEEEAVDEQAAYRAELEAMTVATLRKMALAADYEAAQVKDARKEDLVEGLMVEKFGEDYSEDGGDDSEQDSSDEDQEDEEAAVTREELEEMSDDDRVALALKMGFEKKDLRGLDDNELIDLLLGDEDDDEEDESEDEGDEEDYWDRDSLMALGRVDLRRQLREDFPDVKTGRDWTVENMADAYLKAAGA